MFNKDFNKTYSIKFKEYVKTYDATIEYVKDTNILKVSFLGYNYDIRPTELRQNECPICKDSHYRLGNSGWDCGNKQCVLGAINIDGSLETWQNRGTIDSIIGVIKKFYNTNHCNIEQKEPTLIEREISNIEYRKERELEHAKYLSELDKKYGTKDIHSEYHWSNYGDYNIIESKAGSKMDKRRRYT